MQSRKISITEKENVTDNFKNQFQKRISYDKCSHEKITKYKNET